MVERVKKDLPMVVGIIIALVIVDVILNKSFDLFQALLRAVVGIVVYLFFRFIEFRKK